MSRPDRLVLIALYGEYREDDGTVAYSHSDEVDTAAIERLWEAAEDKWRRPRSQAADMELLEAVEALRPLFGEASDE